MKIWLIAFLIAVGYSAFSPKVKAETDQDTLEDAERRVRIGHLITEAEWRYIDIIYEQLKVIKRFIRGNNIPPNVLNASFKILFDYHNKMETIAELSKKTTIDPGETLRQIKILFDPEKSHQELTHLVQQLPEGIPKTVVGILVEIYIKIKVVAVSAVAKVAFSLGIGEIEIVKTIQNLFWGCTEQVARTILQGIITLALPIDAVIGNVLHTLSGKGGSLSVITGVLSNGGIGGLGALGSLGGLGGGGMGGLGGGGGHKLGGHKKGPFDGMGGLEDGDDNDIGI